MAWPPDIRWCPGCVPYEEVMNAEGFLVADPCEKHPGTQRFDGPVSLGERKIWKPRITSRDAEDGRWE